MVEKLVSIIILNWNTPELTYKCIKYVLKYTESPFEVIVVDNGSFHSHKINANKLTGENIKYLFSDNNLGFSGGNNFGLSVAQGEYICFLNSDAFVTSNWIGSLLTCMRLTGSDIVGPWTNLAKGKQRKKFKHRLYPKCFLKYQYTCYLSFFCILVHRGVFDKIGYLDERFGFGTFEDDDFCHRAAKNNIKMCIDHYSWVWHIGHGSMIANGIDENDLISKNKRIYSEKWRGLS
jgi:GT2 family glycosyltransferase